MLVFAWPILGTRPTIRQVGALILATTGVLVVTLLGTDAPTEAPGSHLAGNTFLLVAAVTWALYSVLGGRVSSRYDALVTTAYATGFGALFTLPLVPWELASTPMGSLDWPIWTGILYLGIVSTAGAFYLWNRSIAHLGASLPGLLFFAQPVVGGLLGATVLGEVLSTSFFIGGALVASAVVLSARET